MAWAKIMLAGGLLVMFAAFSYGTEHMNSTVLSGHNLDCGPSISSGWFVTGTRNPVLTLETGASAEVRQVAAACSSVIGQSRVPLFMTMGAGGLLALAGWAALNKRPETEPLRVSPVNA